MPTVVLVNPNTNAQTTAMMTELVRPELAAAGLTVEGITVAHGPRMLADPVVLAAAEAHVVDAVRRRLAVDRADHGQPRDDEVVGVIVAAIGDPGRDRLEDELELPVIGIGQASILAAARGGRRFGMATSTPLLAGSLTALVARWGHSDTFTGVRLTESEPLVLAADPERQFHELAVAVRACAADGAEAVIIAGGPLSGTARRLAELNLTPIVEPLPTAAALALTDLRSRRSRRSREA
ncbi:Asp/Glu/hydantoin racemase [Kribbella aluminosa]|uniref:Asp/Glu/hydantoin racemase n=1 Tax=Kribbella aluminosa TaxID=416017 RepID=A0ABS4UJJ9_9ACTN|nr:aspartate/glutamate racemase family protein [Kribbella aluminosa]MBP2351822.1 Asp/Glu/hydantoin racemase [Kribbella aluminosa]